MFDKIAELFYPRELKEMIAELRAQDDLNEAAIGTINKMICGITLVFLSFVILFYLSNVLFMSFLFLILLVVGLLHETKTLYIQKIRPYQVSVSVEAEVFQVWSRWPLTFEYRVFIKELNLEAKMSNFSRVEKLDRFSDGQKLKVFYDPEHPHFSMPDLNIYKVKYALQKSKL